MLSLSGALLRLDQSANQMRKLAHPAGLGSKGRGEATPGQIYRAVSPHQVLLAPSLALSNQQTVAQ